VSIALTLTCAVQVRWPGMALVTVSTTGRTATTQQSMGASAKDTQRQTKKYDTKEGGG